MESLSNLLKRSQRFQPKDISRLSGLSRQYIVELRKGTKTNPSLAAFDKFNRAVTKLEAAAKAKKAAKAKPAIKAKPAVKTKSSRNADKKQTPSRDKTRRNDAKVSR